MRFEWDPNKAASNLRKHDVSFESAKSVFLDPLTRVTRDDEYLGEERWIAIGEGPGDLIKVVFTEREIEGESYVRIISARRATRHERREFERR